MTVNIVTRRTVIYCLLLGMAVSPMTALAGSKWTVTHYQTLPGSSVRDYRAPAYVTKGNVTYQTIPGSTTRDYRAPSYVTKGDTTYKTLPGSSVRDYSAPVIVSTARK